SSPCATQRKHDMGIKLTDIDNPKLRERIHRADQAQNAITNPLGPLKSQLDFAPAKRVRQSSKPLMNKLETEFYERICNLFPNVRCQAKRYRLGNGVWYKPDFTISGCGFTETAWEVKGPYA